MSDPSHMRIEQWMPSFSSRRQNKIYSLPGGIVCPTDVTFLRIGKITDVAKSARRHAEEIIAAHFLLQTAVFNVSVSPLNQITNVSQLSNARWLHSAGQPNIRLTHETTEAHVLSSVFFPHAMIRHYDC